MRLHSPTVSDRTKEVLSLYSLWSRETHELKLSTPVFVAVIETRRVCVGVWQPVARVVYLVVTEACIAFPWHDVNFFAFIQFPMSEKLNEINAKLDNGKLYCVN